MGKLHKIGKIEIRVNAGDHLPPHFHVKHHDFQALVEIATMSVLAGSIPSNVKDEVMAWATANRAAIITEWNRVNPAYPSA
jgi:hypothetical protein